MKKLFSFLVCLTLILGLSGLALAQFDREEADNAGYANAVVKTADTNSAISRPCYVYGVQFYAGAATSYVSLYDGTGTTGNDVKVEVSEATAGDWKHYKPEKPIKFDTAVSVNLAGSGSAVIVEYR